MLCHDYFSRTLLIREAALQKRRKAAEELLQWHRKLLEEEKRITELESTANTIISQIPNNIPTSPDVIEKYQFKGKQLNQLWFNLTGCEEKRFNENQIYPMSQIALERFCKSARKYSIKTKISKQGSDSEVSEYSEKRTNDSISENIPDQEISHSASIRTESGKSQHSSFKNESVPITTINDYASDFDIESIQDIVNIEDMDVVDKSINQLIDNFNKIQDDISSLSIKQSLKSDADLEPEDSIRSERTDSDVEVSVIETAKTSKEKSFEEINFELTENNKIINSSKTLSALEGINDIPKNYNDSDKSDIKTSSKIYEEISKCTEDKISTEIPKLTTLSEAHPVEEDNLTKSEDIKSDHNGNKTFYQAVYDNTPSIREENTLNIEGRNNLNKSQEILEELSCLKSQTIEDIPSNNKSAVENIHITDEGKDNLSRSEEILLRLSQSEDKHSIIAFTDIFNEDSLRSELKISLDENDVTKSEGVLLELFPVNEKTSADVSSNSFRSKQETNQLPSEDENSASINSCKDILPIKRPPEVEDAKLENKCREDILNGEIISLSLEVISEKPVEIEESSETNKILAETSEEAIVNIATEEISEFSNKIPLVIEDSSVISDAKNHECMAEIHESEDIDIENKSRSILTDTIPDSEKVTDSLHSRDVSLVALEKEEDQSVPLENISEVIESSETDIDERLSENKETKSNDYTKSLKEEDVAIKDTTCEDTLPSIHEKVSEEFSPSEPIITTEESQNDIGENCDSKISETTVSKKIPSDKPFTDPNNLEKHVLEMKTTEIISQQADVISSTTEETDKSQMASIPENLSVLLSKEDINSYEEKELDSLSSSTTGSQSSILNEKDENQVLNKSESVVAEEKSPTCGAVDVKKRVSEIMADTNQASRGDKSPKLQDFYTTTYDLVSPTNSPELGKFDLFFVIPQFYI